MPPASLTSFLRHLRRVVAPKLEQCGDGELLHAFIERRDEAAFAALVQRHGALVLNVCQRVLGHEQDAEDVSQATFLVLARKAATLRNAASLAGFLHGVAYRLALKAKRDAARRRKHEAQVPPPTSQDTDEPAWREVQALVEEEIERLPEIYRTPFILCYLQGRSNAAAACELGVKEGTIWSRLSWARRRLQDRLARRGVTLSAALALFALSDRSGTAAPARLSAVLPEAARAFVFGESLPDAASARAVELAQAGLPTVAAGKLKLALTGLLLLLATGMGGALFQAQTAKPEVPPPEAKPLESPKRAQAEQPRTDRYGDPLPDGAIARLGTARWQCGFAVYALAYSPNGKMIAAVGKGRAITLWDAATGKEIHRFPNLSEFVDSIAFSPDGKILATGGSVCRLWDVADGKEVRQLLGGRVAFSPDGKLVVTAGTAGLRSDNMLRLWDASSGKEQWHIDCGANGACGLAYSPDGKRIATSDRNGVIRMWEPATGKEQSQLKGHKKGVYRLAFSPDGKHLASSSEDETIRLWNVATGRQVRIVGEKLGVYSTMPIVFSPDGMLLASGHIGGVIRLWDVKTGEEKRHWQAGAIAVGAVVFSPDGKTLASGARYERIRFWDVAEGRERNPSEEHLGVVDLVRFTPDGGGLISAGFDHRLLSWDLSTQKIRRSFSWPGNGLRSIALSPDGVTLAETDFSFPNKELHLWNTRDGKAGRVLGKAERRFEGLAFSPDGRLVAAGMLGGAINIWNVREGKLVRRFKDLRLGTIVALKFSPDSKALAGGFFPGTQDRRSLRLWDVESGQAKVEFSCFEEIVAPVAFSPDGKVLATGFNNHNFSGPALICLWDTSSGKKRSVYKGHRDSVGEIAFSPDGKLVASGTAGWGFRDNSVHVWEAVTGRLIRRFEGRHSCVTGVAFSPDGLIVADGAGDSTILLWDITGRRLDGRWHAKPLTPRQLEACWSDLANDDATKAYETVWALVAAPEQAVPFLQKRLPPVTPPAAPIVARWIADLDSDDFKRRERATEELSKTGETVAPALRRTLEDKPSLEMRRRIQQILDQNRDWTAERLRVHRAIQVLEHMNTRSARAVLQALAEGAPETQRSEEAKAALRRLERR